MEPYHDRGILMLMEEKKNEEETADEIPELAPVEGDEDEYKMPTLEEVEKKGGEGEQREEEPIDLEGHREKEHTACPKCDHDYVGGESFCTFCGAQVVKVRQSVQVKEEIPKVQTKSSGDGVYKAPALEWHEDEPRTFEVACYNCQNVFDATADHVPIIINCPQCQAQLQIEEMPPEEDEEEDEEEMELTPKQPSLKKEKPPSKGCPKCGGKTRFIPRHFKWFCDSCRQWV